MGTLPFPPKMTGHHYPAHLAVEAISNGESGGLFLITHGSKGFLTEASFHCVNNSFFVTKKKNQALHLFRFNGKSAESFGNWERNLSRAALAKWEICHCLRARVT